MYRLVHEGYVVKTPDNFPAKYAIGFRGKWLGRHLAGTPDPTEFLDRGYRPWPEEEDV
ncbi:MAG: hypothetical protein V7607_1231 [Solirubrobacteraceae bacterium]